MSRARAYVQLGRVSNLPTVWTNVIAGVVLAGGVSRPGVVLALVAAVSCAYVGGMFLNDAFDREFDARERPERPIPSGVVSLAEVMSVGFGLLLASLVGVALVARVIAPHAFSSALVAVCGLCVFIVVYDAWHKQNPLAPMIMGLCRGAVYLSAGLASGGHTTPALLAGAAAMVAYVFGLTAVARQENRRRFSGIWPLFLLGSPVLVATTATSMGPAAWGAVAVFVAWVGVSVRPLYRVGDVDVPRAVVRLIAGISLLDGMVATAHGAPVAVGVGIVGLLTTLGLQRFVRGT